MDDMAAPKLVAKGVDHLAMRIREVAEANDVPLVENPPLARALYAGVDIDEEIPAEHFIPHFPSELNIRCPEIEIML